MGQSRVGLLSRLPRDYSEDQKDSTDLEVLQVDSEI